MKVMSTGLQGGTSFMEDYTYHFDNGNDLVLGSHMLEVCPTIATAEKPISTFSRWASAAKRIQRLIFNTQTGPAIVASLIDRRPLPSAGQYHRNRPNAARSAEAAGGQRPVKAQPDLRTASEARIIAGGAHHTVFSHALNLDDMRQFAELHDIELTVIDNDTVCRPSRTRCAGMKCITVQNAKRPSSPSSPVGRGDRPAPCRLSPLRRERSVRDTRLACYSEHTMLEDLKRRAGS